MPLKKCAIDGDGGYKWGNEGKCFTGPDAKKKAIKQGVAIEGPEKFSQKAIEQNILLNTDDIATIANWMYDNGYDNTAVVATVSTLSSYVASEWDKTDKKELKRDTKKEKKEHEKDAIKDDKEKLKRLKKDPSSEKKKRETKDLKKDERYDKRNARQESKGDDVAGYPPNCNKGYEEQDDKCVPIKDV